MSIKLEAAKRRIRGVMFKLPGMITCAEFEEFLQAYFDGELSSKQRILFNVHIAACGSCKTYMAAYRRALEASRALQVDKETLDAPVPEDLVKAILTANRESDAQT
ncbi:zf-HC2 domain-containing protein [Ruegeria sp. SCPT10]|uniref:anti-sigma factor family protein n=1 Tax=Ruegeria sp. SCP10 TaxID=3141377 RepID=UPI003337B544